jgi:hypothetical protein
LEASLFEPEQKLAMCHNKQVLNGTGDEPIQQFAAMGQELVNRGNRD